MRFFWLVVFLGLSSLSLVAQQDESDSSLTTIWNQIEAQPNDVAIVCMPLNNPRSVVFHNAGMSFPLASVSKLLILLEYAQRVDTGAIPLDEMVSVAQLDRYNLPRTDRGAHDRFMDTYPDNVQNISLWDIATEGMIQFSSNAASDYLLNRMAPIDWNTLHTQLGIVPLTYPTPLTMIPLLMNNHETGMATTDTLANLSIEQGQNFFAQYIQNTAWREDEISYRSSGRGGFARRWPSWSVQADILQTYTPVGTANDFRNIMQAIYGNGTELSLNVKYMARIALQWRNNSFINQNYVEYGSKLGFYSGGTLTLVAYGEPIGGAPVISVIFFRNISRFNYFNMVREDSIGDFAHWLNVTGCSQLASRLSELTA